MLLFCFVRYNSTIMIEVKKTTRSLYEALEKAFDHFNQTLFDGKLPRCLITLRSNRGYAGSLSKERWLHPNGTKTHELSINPLFINDQCLIKLFEVIVHEQAHLFHVLNGTSCRYGYHDKNWAETMESLGLVPSHNGEVGGKKTGQKMSQYVLKGGTFYEASKSLLSSGFNLEWVDSFYINSKQVSTNTFYSAITNSDLESLLNANVSFDIGQLIHNYKSNSSSYEKRKFKYTCSKCGVSVWGKANLNLNCGDCNIVMCRAPFR